MSACFTQSLSDVSNTPRSFATSPMLFSPLRKSVTVDALNSAVNFRLEPFAIGLRLVVTYDISGVSTEAGEDQNPRHPKTRSACPH